MLTCLTKFWFLFLSQKNLASDNLASITRWFPVLIKPFLSFKLATSKNKFVNLLNEHRDSFTGVIFLGNSFEAEGTEEVASKIDMPYISTIDNSLLEAASLLEKSCLYIGPDSGLGHIASAVMTPTISFFSLMKPERYRPWGDRAICICGSDNDARNITVDEVSAAVLSNQKKGGVT